jgi:hypothetical protein
MSSSDATPGSAWVMIDPDRDWLPEPDLADLPTARQV